MGWVPRKINQSVNGKTYFLIFIILLISKSVSAAAIDGLKNLEYIVILILLGAVSFLVLLFSFIYRLSKKKRNNVTNIAASTVIISAFSSIMILGLTSIDPGFLATCIGLIIFSILAIFLNYKLK